MSSGPAKLRRAGQQAGFTIIEALVALAMLAAVYALVHQTLSSGWGAVRRIASESRAVAAANAHLELAGTELPLREGEITGNEDGLRWRIDISRYTSPGQPASTSRLSAWWIKVEVAWQETPLAAERVVVLTTVKLGGALP